jgi:hypothetical protein
MTSFRFDPVGHTCVLVFLNLRGVPGVFIALGKLAIGDPEVS